MDPNCVGVGFLSSVPVLQQQLRSSELRNVCFNHFGMALEISFLMLQAVPKMTVSIARRKTYFGGPEALQKYAASISAQVFTAVAFFVDFCCLWSGAPLRWRSCDRISRGGATSHRRLDSRISELFWWAWSSLVSGLRS